MRLVDLVHRLTYTPYGDDLTKAALTLAGAHPLDTVAVADNLRAYQWFLDRAKDGGIPLTTAGYLKPSDVEEASKVVPAMNDWIGKRNRRSNATHCCGSAKACSRWDCCASTRAR